MKTGRSSGNNSRAHDAQPAHTMDENQNPFADRTAASKRADTRRHLWIAAGGAAAIVVAFFVWVAFRLQAQHLDRVRGELVPPCHPDTLCTPAPARSPDGRPPAPNCPAAAAPLRTKPTMGNPFCARSRHTPCCAACTFRSVSS